MIPTQAAEKGERPVLVRSALTAVVAAAAAFSVRSTDLFWHLAAGRWIVEHGRIPVSDPFRFTSGGRAWIDHEWLTELVLYAVERVGGLDGLIALRIALALVLAGVLLAALRRMGNAVPVAALVVLIAILGVRPRFLLRPEPFSFVALALELLLLRRLLSTRTGNRRIVGALFALTVVWVNLHGLAVLAPLVAGGYLLGGTIQRRCSWRRAATVPALLALALCLNPYGWRVFWVPFGILGALRDIPGANLEWLPLWRAPQPYLIAGALALGGLVVGVWSRRRVVAAPALLVTVGFAVLAATAVRNQALFFVAGAFLAGETLALAPPRRVIGLPVVGVCLVALWWTILPPESGPLAPRQGLFRLARGLEPGRFPERAADFLARAARDGRDIGPLYNEFAHGGYLLWRLYPPRQVLFDGRMELEPGLIREIGAARRSADDWDAFLRGRGAVGGLVRYDDRRRPVIAAAPQGVSGATVVEQRTPSAVLFGTERYALVYWDDAVMLFLSRRAPQNAPFLAAEYRAVQPEDTGWTLERAADATFRALAIAEVERKLAEDPACARAAWLHARLIALGR
ncbi:MAG: hypothetical protein ABI609_06360 [Acidobacteriota bacterium]